MIQKNANTFLLIALFCVSFLSYAQDDGMVLLEDADDKLIKFENHYFEALKYKAIGNYTRAITELEKCQQLFTDDVAIDFEFSKNYFALNKYLEAELYIEKSLKSEPENFWFLVQAKKVYLKQFNYTKAIDVQQKIIKQKPALTDDLVLIYIQANEREKARKLIDKLTAEGRTSFKLKGYQKVLSKYNPPKNSIAVKTTGDVHQLKKIYASNKDFKILKEILVQDFVLNNFDELYKYSSEGLELFPAQPLVYLMNGRTFIAKKKHKKAISIFIEGLDFLMENPQQEIEFYKELVVCYRVIGEDKLAETYENKIEKLSK